MHGGLSPDLKRLEIINKIKRPIEVPEIGLLCDLLWSDPDPDIAGWDDNEWGVSYIFGINPVSKFLN